MTEHADLGLVHEEQSEAGNFKKKNSVARGKRFLALRPARLERAQSPIYNEDDPRAFDEMAPKSLVILR